MGNEGDAELIRLLSKYLTSSEEETSSRPNECGGDSSLDNDDKDTIGILLLSFVTKQCLEKNLQIKSLKQELKKQRVEDELFGQPSSSKTFSHESSTEIDQKNKEIESLKNRITQLQRENEDNNTLINKQSLAIETLTTEKTQLQNSLQVKERNISEMNRQIISKDKKITTLTTEKTQLQNSLQVKDRNILERNRQMNSKDQEIETLKNEKAQILEEIESLRGQLEEADDSISAPVSTKAQTTDNSWVIDRKEITDHGKVLGKGGWGEVREAKFRGKKVAVKKLHDIILSPYSGGEFEREIRIAMRMRHPNIVQFMGATGYDEQEMWLVMEILHKDLRSLLQEKSLKGSSLSEQQILQIALDVICALVYLHQSDPPIIHRDVSSANVLLNETKLGWTAKLSDYGSANLIAKSRTHRPGAAIYSAPETSGGKQNQSLDVYSFGVLFCEMLTKELPDPDERQAQADKIANLTYRSLVERCIKPIAFQRPNSMDVLKDIERWMQDQCNDGSNSVQLRKSINKTFESQSLGRQRPHSMVVEMPSNSQIPARSFPVAAISNQFKNINLTGGSLRRPPPATKPKPDRK